MIADWSRLNTLTTPEGNLTLNAASGDRYLTLNERCDSGADLRVTFDNIPQSDGQLNHTQYLTGYRMRLAFALWDGDDPACGQAAQEMLDELGRHINALRNPTGTTRIIWTPENMASRMINEIDLMEKPVVTVEPGGQEGIVTVTFAVCSPFPYEMSESERTPVTLLDGIADFLTNNGSTRFWPVFKVYGPTSSFQILNFASNLVVQYDGDAIGMGDYVEIDNFRGTAYLNGDSSNLLNGIDFINTDFWALEVGLQTVRILGADADILWNDAWL